MSHYPEFNAPHYAFGWGLCNSETRYTYRPYWSYRNPCQYDSDCRVQRTRHNNVEIGGEEIQRNAAIRPQEPSNLNHGNLNGIPFVQRWTVAQACSCSARIKSPDHKFATSHLSFLRIDPLCDRLRIKRALAYVSDLLDEVVAHAVGAATRDDRRCLTCSLSRTRVRFSIVANCN